MMLMTNDLLSWQHRAQDAATLLKAMANANRLLILCMLVERQWVSAGNLAQVTGLSASATSQHLARMRADGLITGQRQGTSVCYSIANQDLKRMIAVLKEIYCP